jgi:DNA processing protein
MSTAVVVVEAARTGGALITARLGAEIGRPVFVVPGDVDRPASEGCNLLIRDGANPVLGADDLIEELGLIIGPPQQAASASTVDLPQSGLTVDELTTHWSLSLSETLARVGKLEIEGLVRMSGDRVIPG